MTQYMYQHKGTACRVRTQCSGGVHTGGKERPPDGVRFGSVGRRKGGSMSTPQLEVAEKGGLWQWRMVYTSVLPCVTALGISTSALTEGLRSGTSSSPLGGVGQANCSTFSPSRGVRIE